MNKICIKAVISGKVQGVFYRYTTVQKAKSLQLTGWVKNTIDGHVELIVCGDTDTVKTFSDWLWQGSPTSEVTHVECQEIPWQEFDNFEAVR